MDILTVTLLHTSLSHSFFIQNGRYSIQVITECSKQQKKLQFVKWIGGFTLLQGTRCCHTRTFFSDGYVPEFKVQVSHRAKIFMSLNNPAIAASLSCICLYLAQSKANTERQTKGKCYNALDAPWYNILYRIKNTSHTRSDNRPYRRRMDIENTVIDISTNFFFAVRSPQDPKGKIQVRSFEANINNCSVKAKYNAHSILNNSKWHQKRSRKRQFLHSKWSKGPSKRANILT